MKGQPNSATAVALLIDLNALIPKVSLWELCKWLLFEFSNKLLDYFNPSETLQELGLHATVREYLLVAHVKVLQP